MPSTTPTSALPPKLAASDPLALVIAGVVEALAGAGVFRWMGLGPDGVAALLAGLMAAAALIRLRWGADSGWLDKAAVLACGLVVGLAAGGLFDRIGFSADGVAALQGLLLAVAAAVRGGTKPAAPAALLVLVFVLSSSGCAHRPTVAGAVDATQVALHGVAVGADASSAAWAVAVDAQIQRCTAEGHETREARAACMGALGRGAEVEDALDQIRDAYDAIAELLESIEPAAAKVDEAMKAVPR